MKRASRDFPSPDTLPITLVATRDSEMCFHTYRMESTIFLTRTNPTLPHGSGCVETLVGAVSQKQFLYTTLRNLVSTAWWNTSSRSIPMMYSLVMNTGIHCTQHWERDMKTFRSCFSHTP